jgi:asparagine synthase (glutamine-hydrolysing)
MCGIAGIASIDRTISPELLLRMRETLHHRGPDDAGLWRSEDGRIGLVHRRLSIIDLSAAGRQPMRDSGDRLQIVFNGEIYNYQALREDLQGRGRRFRTGTDTEVILEAYLEWGTECLERFNGMFAFALYDRSLQRLFLARDRAGEKPLFYRCYGRSIAFASEAKALLADPECPRTLDVDALDFYLAFGYVPGSLCLLKGIRKLPPAHALLWDARSGNHRTWAYWTLPASAPESTRDDDLVDELEHLLLDSTRLRLIADVPVGVLLSGGLDSSLVTALAARASSRRLKTFTISFPGHGTYDEAPHARVVARHFETEHVELAAEPATVDLLPELARQYDEPIADSSMVPTYLVSRLIRREATVALGGDGGDELFGGYWQHTWVQQQARMGGWIPGPARRAARSAVTALLPVGTKGRNYVLGLTAERPMNIVQFNVIFDADARRRLLAGFGVGQPQVAGAPEHFKAALCADRATPLQQSTALDFRTYLPDDILVKVDRASMLCSLEVRAPFLDPRLIELAFARVPDRLRATARDRKILPRRLGARLLPPELDLERKQGFALPLQRWFKGDWGRYIESVLSREDGIFDKQVIRQLLSGQRRGFYNTHRLFALAMVELWRQEYRITNAEAGDVHAHALEHV